MSNREKRIELADGRYAVVRAFIKNRDRSAYNSLVFGGQKIPMKDLESGNGEISLEMSGMIGASDHLIKMLLLDYCGNTQEPFEVLMDSEFGDDYEIIGREVQEVFAGDRNRPKG